MEAAKIKKVWFKVVVIVALGFGIASAHFFVVKPAMEKRALEQAAHKLAKEKLIAQYRKRIEERRAKRAAEAEAQARAEELQRRLKLATLGKGEGPEHPLIRQLVYNPDIMSGVKVKIGQKEYDLAYPEDKSSKKAVKKWAGRTAHLLAIFAGYVDRKTGRQIRVKKAGEVAYLIDVNSDKKRLSVDIYKKDAKAAEAEFSQGMYASTGWLVADQPATFWGDVKNGLTSFEYVWKPIKKSKKQKK